MSLRYEQLSERSGVIVDDQERAVILRALFLYHSDLQECIEGGVATGVTRERTIETVKSLLCDEGVDL